MPLTFDQALGLWDHVGVAVVGVFGGWLAGRAQYRTADAQAVAATTQAAATATQTEAQAKAADRQENRADIQAAVAEWKAIAEKHKSDFEEYRQRAEADAQKQQTDFESYRLRAESEFKTYRDEAHSKLGTAHEAVIGVMAEKVNLAAQVAALTVEVKACNEDRANLRTEVEELKQWRKTVEDKAHDSGQA
jgi:hypothetical protein